MTCYGFLLGFLFQVFSSIRRYGRQARNENSKRYSHSKRNPFLPKEAGGDEPWLLEIFAWVFDHSLAKRNDKVKRGAIEQDRKSSLVSGFDSSTENQTFFKPSGDKFLFAPFLVKIENSLPGACFCALERDAMCGIG
jgi:hypothetical protein